jgi:site-specific DNA recombinase
MSESNSSGKALRFAALVRVSTEGQEKKGESLRTQRKQIEAAVAALGGTVAEWYAGQEHATEGYERKLLDQLLADAGKGRFDAVIVCDPSRWSRDNVKSESGLEALQAARVRFFVLTTEYDLYDPHARLFLGLSSTIGAFQARLQRQKSLLNRIERARRGVPSNGTLPFGRTFDRATGAWSIDPEKQALIRDVAARYLAGEQLMALAKEYGVNHSQLCLTLRERCGTEWAIDFGAKDLNIAERVALTVPALLDEGTIRRVRERLLAKRTHLHATRSSPYLLGGRVFCDACGAALSGQPHCSGTIRYYHHPIRDKGGKCPLRPRPLVRCDHLDTAVLNRLLRMFGSPEEIESACRAAIPDCEKLLRRKARLEAELAKKAEGRGRILGLVARDAVTVEEAEAQLRSLKEYEAALRHELDGLGAQLAELPVAPSTAPPGGFETAWNGAHQHEMFRLSWRGRQHVDCPDPTAGLSLEEKRKIVSATFDVSLPGGKPAGVYVRPSGEYRPYRPKQWAFTVRGRLYVELPGEVMLPRGCQRWSTC